MHVSKCQRTAIAPSKFQVPTGKASKQKASCVGMTLMLDHGMGALPMVDYAFTQQGGC